MAPEIRYVVYMPSTKRATPWPLLVEAGADVAALIKKIRNDDELKRDVESENVYLYKCGMLDVRPPGDAGCYQEAINWLYTNKNKEDVHMTGSMPLQHYFPSGPAAPGKSKIDVIVATESILESLDEISRADSDGGLTPRVSAAFLADTARSGTAKLRAHSDAVPPAWKQVTNGAEPTLEEFYATQRKRTFEDVFGSAMLDMNIWKSDNAVAYFQDIRDAIYIREHYRFLVERIIDFQTFKSHSGIIISGQPGTGKSTFLWFLLACLMTKGVPIVFHWAKHSFFFENGSISIATDPEPREPPTSASNQVIWSLVDADADSQEPAPSLTGINNKRIFCVQASSPNRKRYSNWRKQCGALMWGMSLWSVEELLEGLKHHNDYPNFMQCLNSALEAAKCGDLVKNATRYDRLIFEPTLTTTMAVENTEFRERMPEWTKSIVLEFGKDGDSWSQPADIVKKLVNNAVMKFGEASRDINQAIFWSYEVFESNFNKVLQAASNTSKVDDMMTALMRIGEDDYSSGEGISHLFAVEPRYTEWHDSFVPKFKSGPIGERVKNTFQIMKIENAKKFVNSYRIYPAASALVGWIFEDVAICEIASCERAFELYGMKEEPGLKRKHSSTSPGPQTRARGKKPQNTSTSTTTSQPVPTGSSATEFTKFVTLGKPCPDVFSLSRVSKGIVPYEKVDLIPLHVNIPECVFRPKPKNNALFDAICFQRDEPDNNCGTIWVIQATISDEHDGKKAGFDHVKEFKDLATRWLGQNGAVGEATIAIKYLLVTPEPRKDKKKQRVWKMEKTGWDGVKGEVFCVFLDLDIF